MRDLLWYICMITHISHTKNSKRLVSTAALFFVPSRLCLDLLVLVLPKDYNNLVAKNYGYSFFIPTRFGHAKLGVEMCHVLVVLDDRLWGRDLVS